MPMLLEENIINKLEKINWDFAGEKTQYLTHKFHSYPARYIPQIPRTFIELFTSKGESIFDPMCGSGTTLVEAMLTGRNAIGNDYNPLAVLISKAKTTMISEEDFVYLEHKLSELSQEIRGRRQEIGVQLPSRKLSKLFTRQNLSSINLIKQMIEELKKENKNELCDFCQVALSATIWSFIESEGKRDIKSGFQKKIQIMKKELSLMKHSILTPNSSILVQQGDARNLSVGSNSIDLIVTSPPYVNALDYYREHMYNMYFLDIDVNKFKKNEIGGHSHFIANRFRLLSEYLWDMLRVMIEMNRALKKNKYCVIVVGNSSLEYELIESHKFFKAFASAVGFKHEITLFRNIDKTRKYTSKAIGQIDDEYIIVFKKQTESMIDKSDDVAVTNLIRSELLSFRAKIQKSPGSSLGSKKPTKKRLGDNVVKIDEAIKNIDSDIKINF
ncbi:MAG: hypothetical protein HYR97_09050 [Candidatus Melainabacteria bacterium]|nr:hypothetical protein [Candidatus Melainabacteria bacterium]MBI3308301.1 hypothetical protein [Candidatus Melainabacteria bacterium]